MSLTSEQLQTILAASLKTALDAVASADEKPRVKAPERPDIDLGSSETQWAFFKDEWDVYKRRSGLKQEQVTDELRACCSKELRKTLFDFVGSATLSSLGENDLLERIKSSAVVGKNQSVHRKEFYEYQQAPDEPINRYVAKLRSKAERCNFTQECSAAECGQVNSYADQMVRDQMTCGLHHKDIQQEVFAKDKQLKTFKDTYDLIEAYELGKQAKNQLDNRSSSEVNAARSQYKTNRAKHLTLCQGCGTAKHHGQPRETRCPAWGEQCFKCGKLNHFSRVCQQEQSKDEESKDPAPSNGAAVRWEDYSENNVSWFLAAQSKTDESGITDVDNRLPHVEWNGRTFVKAEPPPLPSVEIRITPLLEYHSHVSKEFSSSSQSTAFVAFTDTCAQTCIAGKDLLRELNIDQQTLHPTRHCIVMGTKASLDISGVLLAKMEYAGHTAYTAVYVSDDMDGLFLSKKVQTDLRILSVDYPEVDQSSSTDTTGHQKTRTAFTESNSQTLTFSNEIGSQLIDALDSIIESTKKIMVEIRQTLEEIKTQKPIQPSARGITLDEGFESRTDIRVASRANLHRPHPTPSAQSPNRKSRKASSIRGGRPPKDCVSCSWCTEEARDELFGEGK